MNRDVFEKLPIPKAVMSLAIPSVLSMLVAIVYNMADTFFVGQTGDPNQVAAVSLTMPLFFIFLAVGNIFGIGGGTFISRSLGAKLFDKIKNISSSCFYMSVAAALALTAVFLIFMTPILHLMGTSEATEGFTRSYLTFLSIGIVFSVESIMLSNIIRAEGAAKRAMLGMIFGSVVNIILDPIMILALGMGVSGAAIATVIGNICSVTFYLLYFRRKDTALSVSPKYFTLHEIWGPIFMIGLPASVNNILMGLCNLILNNVLSSYGDYPVAAMGVALRANMLVVMLQMGFSIGIQPLIGYSYGAKNYTRMKKAIGFTMICTTIIGVALTIAYYFNTEFIITAFIKDETVIMYGVKMLRALMIAGPLLGILFTFTFSFQAMGRAIPSLLLSVARQGLFFLPTLFIANKIWGLDGIIYTQPVTDLLTMAVAAVMFFTMMHNINKKAAEESAAVPPPQNA
ncbi:MAG: MATE family efflux transporter [Clostridia bacterium]|nr:MATE family efflux transporter [Clostridia bacterium]